MMALGFVREELAVFLWGGAFFALVIYAIIGSMINRLLLLRCRNRHTHQFSWTVSPGERYPGQECSVTMRVPRPRSLVPGFSLALRTHYCWRIRSFVREILIGRERESQFITDHFPAPARGRYQGAPEYRCRDLLGFSSQVVSLPHTVDLDVFPGTREIEPPSRRRTMGGSTRPRSRKRESTEELLEVRKYYPGDDVRRMNWKVYAHTGELFIRLAEKSPPPHARTVLVLDTSWQDAPSWYGVEAAEAHLDTLVAACATLAHRLYTSGREVYVSVSGLDEPLPYREEDLDGFLRVLSGTYWDPRAPRAGVPPLFSGVAMEVIFICVPSSALFPQMWPTLSRQGSHGSLLFIEASREEQAEPPWFERVVQRVFFHRGGQCGGRHDGGQPDPRGQPDYRQLDRGQSALRGRDGSMERERLQRRGRSLEQQFAATWNRGIEKTLQSIRSPGWGSGAGIGWEVHRVTVE